MAYFANQLSEEFDTEISVGRVYFKPFKNIVLNDVLVKDEEKDTLVFVQRLSARLDSIFINEKRLYLNNLLVQKPIVNINKGDSVYNYSFLLNAFTHGDSVIKEKWLMSVRAIHFQNGDLRFKNTSSTIHDEFSAKKVEFSLNDIKVDSTVSFNLNTLSLSEASGFEIEGASCKANIGQSEISLRELKLNTYFSRLSLDSLNLDLNAGETGLQKIKHFYLGLNPSYISHQDLRRFVDLKNFSNVPFNLSGSLYGSIDNIKGRNVRFDFGSESSISTSFDLNGLPDVDQTFLYLNVKQLITSPADLQNILSYGKGNALKLPKALEHLDKITYKGNFTGFLTDIVAFGQFNTSMGSIKTDIGLKYNEKEGLVFAGNLNTAGFDIGELVGAENRLDNLSMSVTIRGNRKSSDSFYAYLDGVIDTLSFNEYDYTNINLNGLFSNNKFDGWFALNDPNGKMAFKGKIDLSTELPNFNFNATLRDVKLDKLNLMPQIPDNNLSLSLETDFTGKDLNDIIGYVKIKDATFYSPDNDVIMDSLLLVSVRDGDQKHLVLQSDVLEGDLIGTYNFTHLRQVLTKKVQQYLPALELVLPQKDIDQYENNFTFSCRFKKISDLVQLLEPDVYVSDKGLLLGKYNSLNNTTDLNIELAELRYKGIRALDPEMQIASGDDDKLTLVTRFKEMELGEFTTLQNFSLHHQFYKDTIVFNAYWNNWNEYNNSGSIHTKTHIRSNENGLYASINLDPSYIMVRDSLWEIQSTTLNYHPMGFSMKNFRIHHKNQELGINGFIHKQASDGMMVHFQNIRLQDIVEYRSLKELSVSGLLNGTLNVADLYRTPIVSSDIDVKGFEFNDDEIGDLYLSTNYLPDQNLIALNSKVKKGDSEPLNGGGSLNMETLELDLNYKLDSLEIGFLNLYLSKIMQNLSGTASGKLAIKGQLTAPELVGGVNINKAFFDVGLLKTTYSISDSILFTPNGIDFMSLSLHDRYGQKGSFDGTITHTGFRSMSYNLILITDNMLVLDTKYSDNPLYYGTVHSNGNMLITGTTKDLYIDIAAETKENTNFYIPLRSEGSAEETDFIRFVSHNQDEVDGEETEVVDDFLADLAGMTISMDLDITPEAKTQVIFDSKIGDILKGSGNGNIQIRMDKEGGINFFGDFSFDEGDYMFTLQNVINKRFIINPGSSIRWDGNPYDANIDLNATYKLKTSLYDLVRSNVTDEQLLQEYNRRIPVHCNLLLTDRLMKPAIKFDIETPSDQNNNQDVIDAYINTEEDLNRQVLSLLILNRFYTDESLTNSGAGNRTTGNNAALVTTTEVLSNQLSHWLSQISNDFDIGVSYRPGDEGVTSNEVEVALSTQVFNNRVSINGNVGYGQDDTRTSNLIGDFDVEVKLNKSGSLRGKAYTHTNNDVIYTESPTRQGVGISFEEEFDSLKDLMHSYWLKISGKGNKKEDKEENKD